MGFFTAVIFPIVVLWVLTLCDLVGGTEIILAWSLMCVGLGSDYLPATVICTLTISSPFTFQPWRCASETSISVYKTTWSRNLQENDLKRLNIFRPCNGCTDLEEASQEAEVLEIHCYIPECYVHVDVLCLKLAAAFNLHLGETFDVHVGQSDIEGTAGATEPRRHRVVPQDLQLFYTQTHRHLEIKKWPIYLSKYISKISFRPCSNSNIILSFSLANYRLM